MIHNDNISSPEEFILNPDMHKEVQLLSHTILTSSVFHNEMRYLESIALKIEY